MIKKTIFFFCIILFCIGNAQNIKVTYIVNNSGVTDHTENVYLNNGYKVSVTDSIAIKKYGVPKGTVAVVDKGRVFRKVIISDAKTKNTYFTYAFNNQNYLVSDVIPAIKWKINPKETKKVGKYLCKKATTTYRGTDIEAYFTTEIPVSLAPEKLGGLPGLVMEMRTFGQIYKIWKLQSIEYPYNGVPNYSRKYIKSLKSISIKDLVAKIDAKIQEEFDIMQSKLKLPEGVKIENVTVERINPRNMLETKFEWEK